MKHESAHDLGSPRATRIPRLRLVPVSSASTASSPPPARLKPGTNYVGRRPENDVVLQSSLVSRRHAKLMLNEDGVVLYDLDSHNGVFVDGRKIRSAAIEPGQALYFADVCCTLEPVEDANAAFALDTTIAQLGVIETPLDTQSDAEPMTGASWQLVRGALRDAALPRDEAYCRALLELCMPALDAEQGMVLRVDPGGELVLSASVGDEPEDLAGAWSFARRAIEARALLRIPVSSAGDASGWGGLVCVPLCHEGACAGVLYLARAPESSELSGAELEALLCVAGIAGARLAGVGLLPSRAGLPDAGASAQDALAAAARAEARAREQEQECRRLQAELDQAWEAMRNQLSAAALAPDAAGAESQRQIQQLRATVAATQDELSSAQERERTLRLEVEASAQRVRELEQARGLQAPANALEALLARVLPSRSYHSLRNLAAGGPAGAVTTETRTLVSVALSGMDAWVQGTPADALRGRLDWLCERMYEVSRELGGEVEQAHGHALLVRFPGQAEGALAAVRAALQLVAEATALGGQAQAGVHLGLDLSGFFGPTATLLHAGEAVAVARLAAEFAPPGAVYASESVCATLPAGAGILPVALGPHFVRALGQPVNLYQLLLHADAYGAGAGAGASNAGGQS